MNQKLFIASVLLTIMLSTHNAHGMQTGEARWHRLADVIRKSPESFQDAVRYNFLRGTLSLRGLLRIIFSESARRDRDAAVEDLISRILVIKAVEGRLVDRVEEAADEFTTLPTYRTTERYNGLKRVIDDLNSRKASEDPISIDLMRADVWPAALKADIEDGLMYQRFPVAFIKAPSQQALGALLAECPKLLQ